MDLQRLHAQEDIYKLVSFVCITIIHYVLLDYTIDVTLRWIYTEREIESNKAKEELRHLFIHCTKIVHFFFNGQMYLQNDGIAMGSPLGLVIAGIFMVQLERNILPTLSQYMRSRKRYVDDAIWYVKVGCIEHVLNTLNSFHANISLAVSKNAISFFNVLIMGKSKTIETTVYRKQIHWV